MPIKFSHKSVKIHFKWFGFGLKMIFYTVARQKIQLIAHSHIFGYIWTIFLIFSDHRANFFSLSVFTTESIGRCHIYIYIYIYLLFVL